MTDGNRSRLIRFDSKTRFFLASLLFFFLLATLFRLHGSSMGVWNQVISGQKLDLGILAGTPKEIRSDEWLGTTIEMVSQSRLHPSFPLINPAWGPAEVPLIANLPARHWSMLLRPQYWGFFLLD